MPIHWTGESGAISSVRYDSAWAPLALLDIRVYCDVRPNCCGYGIDATWSIGDKEYGYEYATPSEMADEWGNDDDDDDRQWYDPASDWDEIDSEEIAARLMAEIERIEREAAERLEEAKEQAAEMRRIANEYRDAGRFDEADHLEAQADLVWA